MPPQGLNNVIAVRAGQSTSFAIKSDHTAVEWGGNDMPQGLTGIADLQIGGSHGLMLSTNGSLLAWGGFWGFVPADLSGVSAISTKGNHNLVITAWPVVSSISPPVSTTVGANVTLSVTATGLQLSYQWLHNGVTISGATNSSLTITSVQPSDAGAYSVLVTNPYGNTPSPSTSISFPPPAITTQPESITRYRGDNASFVVAANGLAPLKYQWLLNQVALTGSTNPLLGLTLINSNNAGSYRVLITDAAGGSVTKPSRL